MEIEKFIKGMKEALHGFKISYKAPKRGGGEYTITFDTWFASISLHLPIDLMEEEKIGFHVEQVRRQAIEYLIGFSTHAKITEARLEQLEEAVYGARIDKLTK